MGEMSWVVAYNIHTRSWESGGEIKDYPQEHNDVFVVMAPYRETAEKLGQGLRKKCTRLGGANRMLLDGLLVECGGINTGEVIDIQPYELAAASKLEKIGLIEVVGGPQSRCVRLTHMAFNPCMEPGALRAARVGQEKMERKTPEIARPAQSKPRL